VTWGNLTVLFVDDGAAYLEAQHPRDERRRTDFGRWEYWLIKTGTEVQGMQTTEGIGIGSSLDDVTAAYPDAQVGEDYGGTYAELFPQRWGVPTILDSDSLLRGSVHARAAAEVQSAVQG
jgi:hypothetical protein